MTDELVWQRSTPIRRTGGFMGLPETIVSVRAAYVRGDIELDELERRVERLIREGRDYEPPPMRREPAVSVEGIRQGWVRMGIPRGWHPALFVVGGLGLVGGLIDTFV